MSNKNSLSKRILTMLILSAVFMAGFITFSGCLMIYNSAENGIEKELSSSARTMYNILNTDYPGSYSISENALLKGETLITEEIFNEACSIIGCEKNIDFTLFINNKRLFTSVKNSDGTNAVGTLVADTVTANVIQQGKETYYRNVSVNGKDYLGFYIPLFDDRSDVVGMVFAGKPLDSASHQTVNAMIIFTALSGFILILSLIFCSLTIGKIIMGLVDIKDYIAKVANGDFSAILTEKTALRKDEIGDIARNSRQLCINLRDMVERDPLTMLLNRRSARAKLDEFTAMDIPYSAVMTDLDYFKSINDHYGHDAGDMVLRSVSGLLSEYSEANGGFAARWGGEEFLLIFPNLSLEETEATLSKLLEDIRTLEYKYNDQDFRVTMTLGATEHIYGETVEETIKRADNNLYCGKQEGRNRIIII